MFVEGITSTYLHMYMATPTETSECVIKFEALLQVVNVGNELIILFEGQEVLG